MVEHASVTAAGSNAARDLARQTDRPLEEAEAAYGYYLALLAESARVTRYLPILAQRAAREDLKKPR